jgi:ribosome-associated protein
MEFELYEQEFIELNKLLKLLDLVETGGEAKMRIELGEVKVNGEVEFRKRNKLRKGDRVEYRGKTIKIM